MAVSEDQVARGLRRGELNVDAVLYLLDKGEVDVYPAETLNLDLADWDEVGDQAAQTSGIMADLRNAGATEADLAEADFQIERARNEGRIITAGEADGA